ncbi:MAG: trimethylamine methyltransferase family protein [Spirochaetales bacterium]|nr:trimethylamine methyltransferase family protein [Spirochaetales bacterium]
MQAGISAPATLTATMALQNAEILAGMCITQLVNPGTPICYGGICHAFDMRTTQIIFGGPEQAVFGVGIPPNLSTEEVKQCWSELVWEEDLLWAPVTLFLNTSRPRSTESTLSRSSERYSSSFASL